MRPLTIVFVVVVVAAAAAGLAYYAYQKPAKQVEQPSELVVLAAPIAKPILDRALSVFENQTGVRVLVSYEASGSIYTKLREGVPVDVVVFASSDWGDKAIAEGLVYSSPSTGLGYQVVLIYVRENVPHSITCLDDLAEYDVKVGIANPSVAPAGYEAMRIINQSSKAPLILSRIAVAKDIAELVTWYKLGAVDVAFIWNTFNSTLANITRSVIYPWRCGYNTSIYYSPVYVSKTSKNVELAKKLVEFLSSEYVKNVAKSLGFFASRSEAEEFIRSTSK
ncbi:MAG: molybdate ABC transporter substrate-binding protein [Desulfurococcaceae archaeon]